MRTAVRPRLPVCQISQQGRHGAAPTEFPLFTVSSLSPATHRVTLSSARQPEVVIEPFLPAPEEGARLQRLITAALRVGQVVEVDGRSVDSLHPGA